MLAGAVVTGTDGNERVTRAHVAPLAGERAGSSSAIACDLLLVSGGWNPAVHLFSQAGGGSATTRRSVPSCPVKTGRAWSSPGPPPASSTCPALWPTGGGRPGRR